MFDDPKHLSFATDRLPWQRSLRWTRPAIDARRVALGILLGIVLTAIELIAFGIGMHRQIANQTPARPPDVVLVQLIDDTAFEFPAIPEPEPPIRAASRAMPHVRPVTVPFVSPPAPSNATSSETPALRLYDPDGHLRLPESIAPGIGAETGFSAPSRAPGDAFARRNPVPYEPTRFESVWTPSGETRGGELIRKTTFTKTWRTPWGSEVSCSVSLVLGMIGGCGWGHAPTAPIEELQAMRADPPMPKPSQDDANTGDDATQAPEPTPPPLQLSLPVVPDATPDS